MKWTKSLLPLLLGHRSAIRYYISPSIADTIYGTNLRLPDQTFVEPTTSKINSETFVGKLQSYMNNLKPIKSHQPTQSENIFAYRS